MPENMQYVIFFAKYATNVGIACNQYPYHMTYTTATDMTTQTANVHHICTVL